MKNYYQILGLNRNASSRKIRKETLRLAKELHRKINDAKILDDPKEFIDVVEAYTVLYDDDSRFMYDLLLDCEDGTKQIRPEALQKHKSYLEVKAMNGRENGAYYVGQSFREFKGNYGVINWWDISTLIPWP